MKVPAFLCHGDQVGIVATAKKVNTAHTNEGIEVLKAWGLRVKVGKHVFHSFHQFAGTDEQRAQDLQDMINDPEIKAIFMVRGGYGSTRILDRIDFQPLIDKPIWICGFSDITAFHLHLCKLGIVSVHAPMPSFFYALNQQSIHYFKDFMFGKKLIYKNGSHPLNKAGVVNAPLTGGNLSIICHTIGTPSQIDTNGHILFIEDVGEQLYNLDRMMVQLKRGGFLNELAGLIVGQFSDMKDNDEAFGLNANEIIYSHTKDYNYPIAFNFPVGHEKENYPLPLGLETNFTVNNAGTILEIIDPGVAMRK